MNGGETKQDGSGNDSNGAQHDSRDAAAAGPLQLTKEHPAPQETEERVGVPQWKGDGEADVADSKDGQRIGNSPKSAGEQRPDNEVFLPGKVAQNVAGSFEQGREGPARSEDARHHP